MSVMNDLRTLAEKYLNKQLKTVEEVLEWAHDFRKKEAYAFDDGEIGIDYDHVGRLLKNLAPEHELILESFNAKTSKEEPGMTAQDKDGKKSNAKEKAKKVAEAWAQEG